MIVQCPNCGHPVVVNGLGRKRLNIPVKNIRDAIARYGSITTAAGALGCSRGYIYQIMRANRNQFK